MPQQREAEQADFLIHEDDQEPQCTSDADHYENDSVSEANTTRDDESSVEDETERSVSSDVQRFRESFVGIETRYNVIKRIGEGTQPRRCCCI
jgi:cell division control protein 7